MDTLSKEKMKRNTAAEPMAGRIAGSVTRTKATARSAERLRGLLDVLVDAEQGRHEHLDGEWHADQHVPEDEPGRCCWPCRSERA